MVNVSNNSQQSVSIHTNSSNNISAGSSSANEVSANTNGNAMLARGWAIGVGLIQGEDYSSKYHANQAKTAKNELLNNSDFIAVSNHISDITAVSADLSNIDTLANNINTYNNLLLYEELE